MQFFVSRRSQRRHGCTPVKGARRGSLAGTLVISSSESSAPILRIES